MPTLSVLRSYLVWLLLTGSAICLAITFRLRKVQPGSAIGKKLKESGATARVPEIIEAKEMAR